MVTSSFLVELEMREVDQVHLNLIEDVDDTRSITLSKTYPGDAGRDLDPNRWHTHPDDLAFFQEKVQRESGEIEPKLPEHRHDPFCISRMNCDPDVHIGGGPRIAMIGHCVTTDEQVLNLMCVEQPQELFEVGR